MDDHRIMCTGERAYRHRRPRNDYVFFDNSGAQPINDVMGCQAVGRLQGLFKLVVQKKFYRLSIVRPFTIIERPRRKGSMPQVREYFDGNIQIVPIGSIIRNANIVKIPSDRNSFVDYVVNNRIDLETFNAISADDV